MLVAGNLANRYETLGRDVEVTRELAGMVATIEGGTSSSRAMGALLLFGSDRDFLVTDTAALNTKLKQLKTLYYVDGAFILARNGDIIADANGVQTNYPSDIQRLAQRNLPSIFPVTLDTNTKLERGIYLTAPIVGSTSKTAQTQPTAGTVVAKVGIQKLEYLLKTWSGGPALLISPQQIVFAASREDWISKIISPATEVTAVATEKSRSLPALIDEQTVQIDGIEYFVRQQTLDWNDPDGDWRVVLFDQRQNWWQSPSQLTAAAITGMLLAFVLGWVYLLALTNKKMQAAQKAAIENSQAKSDFLANMSHEIRTPLNGVIGMCDLLLDTTLDKTQLEFTHVIQSSSEALLTVVNDILDFSKIEAGKLDIEVIDFDLRRLVDDFVPPFAMRAQDAHLEFIVQFDPTIPAKLKGDPGRVRQILSNFVGNAIKFTHHGEIALRIQTLSRGDHDVALRFSVRDTGIGVPADKLATIFEKFSQADTSTTRKYGGTGLGLTISKRLAELMGGKMGVNSEVGQGSEFWFELQFPVPEQTSSEILPAAKLDGIRILGVDDNATNRDVLANQLRSWGAQVDLAVDGPMALQMLSEIQSSAHPFKVAILDMQMPEMDGAELGQRIRENPAWAQLPLIMMTSVGQRGDAHKFEAIGFDAYLVKPVRPSDLRDALAIILKRQSVAQQAPAAAPIITHHSIEDMRSNAANILLVEDNLVNQRLALELLKRLNYRAKAVNNGLEAVEILKHEHFDLVLMDMMMPEMDGIEATRHIRRPETGALNPEITIIALTANVMESEVKQCFEVGMNDFLPKPINRAQFTQKLETWLGKAEK